MWQLKHFIVSAENISFSVGLPCSKLQTSTQPTSSKYQSDCYKPSSDYDKRSDRYSIWGGDYDKRDGIYDKQGGDYDKRGDVYDKWLSSYTNHSQLGCTIGPQFSWRGSDVVGHTKLKQVGQDKMQ